MRLTFRIPLQHTHVATRIGRDKRCLTLGAQKIDRHSRSILEIPRNNIELVRRFLCRSTRSVSIAKSGGYETKPTWKTQNQTLFTMSPIKTRFFIVLMLVAYTLASKNATGTSRSSCSNALTYIYTNRHRLSVESFSDAARSTGDPHLLTFGCDQVRSHFSDRGHRLFGLFLADEAQTPIRSIWQAFRDHLHDLKYVNLRENVSAE